MLVVLLLLTAMMISIMAIAGYFGYKQYKHEEPIFTVKVVDGEPQITKIEPSDCKGDTYVKKKECSRNGVILNGSGGKCGAGKEEWILDPNAPGFTAAIGSGACPIDYRDCDVPCDTPCRGDNWIEGACIRDGIVLDGSNGDKCGRGMRTYTLNENAPDYKAATGRGICTKAYSSACDVECPPNVVAPPSCVYSSTWQKSANGCVVSKDDNASIVGYDQVGWREKFKLALEAENCTGEKRLSEWETCKGPPAPVNCEGTWGANDGWGPCIGSCGTQPSQIRTYTVTKEAANGGTSCPYTNGEVETRNCGSVVTCPVDCEGRWIDTVCPTACGVGESKVSKTWYTTKYPQGTGKACPAPDDPEGQKTCPATAPCPSDCEGYYDDPACPTACGRAASTVTKRWNTRKNPIGTGKACPSPSTKSCPATAPCPSNCAGSWSNPPCPTACGTAASTITNTWNTTTPAVGNGTCPSPSSKSCPATASCPWVKSGECRADGTQLYTRGVVNNGDATSKTENCCYEGNAWQNYMCNPDNSAVQRKTLVNCPQSYAQRTVPGACNYQKCTVQTWKDSNFRSHSWKINDTLPNVSATGSRHDEITSYSKYGNCKATAYEHPNYGGWAYTLQEGRHAGLPRGINDRISSIKIEHLPYRV